MIRAAVMMLLLAGAVPVAWAQTAPAEAAPAPAGDALSRVLVGGEVRRVDPSGGRITIRHGEIPNLGMPPMTMVFRAADPALIATLKAGDKIRFAAEKVAGGFVVTHVEPAQ